ncbi:MAG TPA: hypothetical protein VME43_27630 [Bryobacteraceae bacterium]|nr:hypothetical protein [Bryobacteraceae bacterium]
MSAVQHIHCPNCGASDVRESHRHSLVDAILAMFGLVAYRCRACRSRFHKRPPDDSEGEFEEEDQESADEESGKDPR